MVQIHALTPEGRLPSGAVQHVQEMTYPRPNLDASTDFNTIRTTSVQSLAATPTDWQAQHLPQNARGTLEVAELSSGAVSQTFTTWALNRPREYKRAYYGGTWGEWFEIGPDPVKSTVQGASTDLDTVQSVGLHELASVPTDWQAQHYPTSVRGVLHVLPIGPIRYQIFYEMAGTRVWTRDNYKGSTWGEWRRLGTDASPVPASGFKTVGMPLTAGHVGQDAPLAGTYRIHAKWLSPDVPVTRVKARLRNINIRSGATRPGSIDLDGIWLGVPDLDGHFSTDPVQVSGPVTFDGAEGYESPWVDVPGGTLADKAISYAYTATAAPWAMLCDGWYDPDQVGGSAGGTGFAYTSTCAFAVDLIVETYATTPVLAVMGDSNSVGVGSGSYVGGAWGTLLAHQLRAIPQILGSSGDTLEASADTSRFKWTRFADHTPADAALLALGQNDASGARTLTQIEEYASSVAPAMESVGRRVYAVSTMPRTVDPVTDFETRRRTINTWYQAQQWGIDGYLDIVPAMSADDETILPEYDSDGTHLNAAGFQAVADRIAATYKVTAPATYPPATHTHEIADVTGLQDALPRTTAWEVLGTVPGLTAGECLFRWANGQPQLSLKGVEWLAGASIPWTAMPAGSRIDFNARSSAILSGTSNLATQRGIVAYYAGTNFIYMGSEASPMPMSGMITWTI